MKGSHSIIVQNNRLHYELLVKRNITIILGDSATGKTTLVEMLRQYMDLGPDSGVEVNCDVPCAVLEGRNWQAILSSYNQTIIFIDEGNIFVSTEAFASAVKGSDNYFVLITRENLYNLPYSIDEIYGLHSSGKYQNSRKVYQQTYKIYTEQVSNMAKPEMILVEDSNSGFEFFAAAGKEKGIICQSAGGKSNLYKALKATAQEATVCVVADGAALGAEMARLRSLARDRGNIIFYLPESFEWLILEAGLLNSHEIRTILERPEEFIESRDFFSWEQFFTKLLTERTQGTPFRYGKKKLNPVYLHERNKRKIVEASPLVWLAVSKEHGEVTSEITKK